MMNVRILVFRNFVGISSCSERELSSSSKMWSNFLFWILKSEFRFLIHGLVLHWLCLPAERSCANQRFCDMKGEQAVNGQNSAIPKTQQGQSS